MNQVARPEAKMLAVARGLFTTESDFDAALASGRGVAEKLGKAAMRILQDTIAKGVVRTLAQLGGVDKVDRDRRVIDVVPAPRLEYGPYTFALLQWLCARSADTGARFDRRAETLGDEIIAYLVCRRIVARAWAAFLSESAPGLACPLTWLGFPRVHTGVASVDGVAATEDRRTVLRCLARDLATRWSLAWSVTLPAPRALAAVTAERAVVDQLLDALQDWRLATFFVRAGKRVLSRPLDVDALAAWAAPSVVEGGTLREETESRRRSGALFHALVRIAKKRDELGLIRFIDEGYDEAQATLTEWEILPRDAFTRAEAILGALDALR
jgi:hypothetical protein